LRMESRVRSLEARRLHAAGIALRTRSTENNPFLTDDVPGVEDLHHQVIESIGLFIDGRIDRAKLNELVLETHRNRRQREVHPTLMTALGLTILISDPALDIARDELRRHFRNMLSALGCRRPLPVGALINCLGESQGRLEFFMQETPGHREGEDPGQWADLALDWPEAGPRLFPASVFTRQFFHDTVRSAQELHPRTDLSGYHRENDKAPLLVEQYPRLAGLTDFEYYIDQSGLSEIVLHTEHLDWGERFHAARLFALYSNLERATIEGVPLLNR